MADGASLKERIRRGDIVIGVSAPFNADKSQLEEILGKDSYDFLSVDSQHSPYNEERVVEICGLAAELGVPVQFRIKHTRHAYLIGNILDLGPLGIEIPIVEEEATVDEAIEAFYYPQVGRRSWGGAARYGIEGRDDASGICGLVEPHRYSVPADGVGSRGDQCAQTCQAGRRLFDLGAERPALSTWKRIRSIRSRALTTAWGTRSSSWKARTPRSASGTTRLTCATNTLIWASQC